MKVQIASIFLLFAASALAAPISSDGEISDLARRQRPGNTAPWKSSREYDRIQQRGGPFRPAAKPDVIRRTG
ncbi:hypothetical protein P691DRAFT_809714 [Macrolepiota fuliginosa MF-IS2]|uniref:Uncharacterized protein n=1 Tax=Macrolepiota fuliginosa MF-IS2 TaxID=1400762 RepID=A0A9P5XI15_9AGAR|nr:hypothetical protein P691DRAFT_809714 [Macrolepiota fuliginosa MF-IS2]